MVELFQGDIIKISGFRSLFLVVSNNAFIQATQVIHVCPVLQGVAPGPLHILVTGMNGTEGTIICEQIKLMDPVVRNCRRTDRLHYNSIMDISDALQGIFEYD